MTRLFVITLFLLPALALGAQQERELFEATLTVGEMSDKQAVVETTAGTFVIDLLAEAAPNHVGFFLQPVSYTHLTLPTILLV